MKRRADELVDVPAPDRMREVRRRVGPLKLERHERHFAPLASAQVSKRIN